MLRILTALFFLLSLSAEEQMVRINSIPAELRGTFIVTHQAEYAVRADIPIIRSVDQLPRLSIPYEMEISGNGVTLGGQWFVATNIHRMGNATLWENGDCMIAFGASLIPGYKIMFIYGPADSTVALCR